MAREEQIFPGINLSDPNNKEQVMMFVATADGPWDINLTPCDPRRSNNQNRYFHGVICVLFARWLKQQGWEEHTIEFAKSILKEKFLLTTAADPETGEEMQIARSTAALSRPEFADFIDSCISWLRKWCGIVVPSPNPAWRMDPGDYGVAPAKEKVTA